MYNEIISYLMFLITFKQRAVCTSSMGVRALMEQAKRTGCAETLLCNDGDSLCVQHDGRKYTYIITHYHYNKHVA